MFWVESEGGHSLPLFAEHLTRVEGMKFSAVHAAFSHYAKHASLIFILVAWNCEEAIFEKVVISSARVKIFQSQNIHFQFLTALSHAIFSFCHALSTHIIPLCQQCTRIYSFALDKLRQSGVGISHQKIIKDTFGVVQVPFSLFFERFDDVGLLLTPK